jgi:glycosyltransferase involved in cell wall biosynthesis
MIRVLNILDTIKSGGVERRRLSMAKLLDKSKFELKIICTNAVGPFPEEFAKYDVEIIEIGSLLSFLNIKQHKKVMKVIDDFKPHIIHGAVFEGVTMASINGLLKRVPIIILEETSDPQTRRWKGNLLMKLLTIPADKVIGVSPASTKYLIEKLNISKSKVQLIDNGVALPNSVDENEVVELKRELNITANQIIIGTVGRLLSDSNKRFSDLIKALNLLIKKGIDAKLIIVGEGKEKINYQNLAAELGITDKVIFAGYQNEVANYYEIFDIFSLVSSHESFGLVLAEAMLHKLPVVATRVGGMQYIVEHEKTGFLVEKYNVEEIASRLEELCLNKTLRKDMGQNGFERAMNYYTEDKYVEKIQSLYLSLFSKISK